MAQSGAQLGNSDENRKRWHLGFPLIERDHTWVLNNNRSSPTRENLKRLLDVAPPGFHVREEGESD